MLISFGNNGSKTMKKKHIIERTIMVNMDRISKSVLASTSMTVGVIRSCWKSHIIGAELTAVVQ